MKIKRLSLWLIILVIVVGGLLYGIRLFAVIFNGYAAKDVCSCIYLSDREQESIEQNDLNSFFVGLPTNEWDEKNKTVTSSFLGLATQTAVYREGLGCALINDADLQTVKNQKYNPEFPKNNPDTIYWPSGDKMRDTLPTNINIEKLDKAIADALNEGHTRAIVVAYDTIFMKEAYNYGFTKDTRILGWSMTKSIMSALTGIRIKQNKLSLEGELPINEWSDDNRKEINLKNLLQMSSGLQWVENYSKICDATIMLFQKSNTAEYAISSPAKFPPDSVWYYSSGTSNIISEVIKRSFSSYDDYISMPRNELFNKIGMRSMVLETDASGTFVGSSYAFGTPRDWARFGLLYLKDGYWGNEQIFPEGWVDFTATAARKSKGEYGAQFWLNSAEDPELPSCPYNIFFADGFNGQRVYIVPDYNLVIVRMGLSKKGEFNYDKFVRSILDSFEK
ncbi:MAG: serine hydrolase [Marinilabiliales bacterium]|nr:MAG: serine hydrolase [Marinilabiliales bacterium]